MGVPLSAKSAAGAAVNLKVNGRPGYRIRIMGANVSFSAAPAAPPVAFQLQEGGGLTVRFDLDLAAIGPQNLFPPDDGWEFEVGQDVTASVAAAGGAIITKLNVAVDYEPDPGPSR